MPPPTPARHRGESGLTMVELLIAIVIITSVTLVGNQLNQVFNRIGTALQTALG